MKIDKEYSDGLLRAFEKSEHPTTDILELKKHGFDYEEERFIFHLRILYEKGLIEPEIPETGLGYQQRTWSVLPLRLTAKGHEYLETLPNPDEEGFSAEEIEEIKRAAYEAGAKKG